MNNLTKKNILIVGGSGLIGSTLVGELLASGANIISADKNTKLLNSQKTLLKKNKNYFSSSIDITNLESIKKTFEKSEKKFGKIDAVLNLAYPKNSNFGKNFWDVTIDSFSENLSTHLGGYFLFMQQCAKYSIDKNKSLSLINFSSIYGFKAPRFDIYEKTNMTLPVEYAAIKSAILQLSLYVSAFTKNSKFRVNCISPGGILNNQEKEFVSNYNSFSRTKGMLDPEDLLGAVVFLCSDSSKFICGQNIVIDDGFTL